MRDEQDAAGQDVHHIYMLDIVSTGSRARTDLDTLIAQQQDLAEDPEIALSDPEHPEERFLPEKDRALLHGDEGPPDQEQEQLSPEHTEKLRKHFGAAFGMKAGTTPAGATPAAKAGPLVGGFDLASAMDTSKKALSKRGTIFLADMAGRERDLAQSLRRNTNRRDAQAALQKHVRGKLDKLDQKPYVTLKGILKVGACSSCFCGGGGGGGQRSSSLEDNAGVWFVEGIF